MSYEYSTTVRSAQFKVLGDMGPVVEIRSDATSAPVISEIELSIPMMSQSGVDIVLGVGTPATRGITSHVNDFILVPHDPNQPTAGVTMATAWNTLPTTPTNFLRRFNLMTGTVGTFHQAVFFFPRGLKMNTNSSLVVWGLGSNVSSATMLFDVSIKLSV